LIQIRPGSERGHFDHGWLDTFHTFSFGGYRDPAHMGFRKLRVLNEDRVQPGAGFGTHGHWEMEVLTMVVAGALEHKDSLGNSSVTRSGELQRMTAGIGIRHSEYNASDRDILHFLQLWILPDRENLKPAYEQRAFPEEERRGALRLVGSPDGRDGSLTIHQDVEAYTSLLDAGASVNHAMRAGRHAWLQVVSGNLSLNGEALTAGDGAAVSEESELRIAASEASELLLLDLG
jgi:redox-sensitive bicupin YhaK (pirin superfamily)